MGTDNKPKIMKFPRRPRKSAGGDIGMGCKEALMVLAGQLKGRSDVLCGRAVSQDEAQKVGRYLAVVSEYLERLSQS